MSHKKQIIRNTVKAVRKLKTALVNNYEKSKYLEIERIP